MVVDEILDPWAILDLREMAKAGSSPELHVVAQVNQVNEDPVRYRLEGHDCVLEGPYPGERLTPRLGTGNPKVLRDFLAWLPTVAPAEHYLLVLWGHFLGIGFGRDAKDPRHDPLTLVELGKALKAFVDEDNGGQRIDILGCDTCRMSLAEAAYQFRDSVALMLASEIGTELAGWPYKDVLLTIQHRGSIAPAKAVGKRPTLAPAALGRSIVRQFVASYRPPNISFTMLDLLHADDLLTALRDLVAALDHTLVSGAKQAKAIIQALADASPNEELLLPGLIDLHDLCLKLRRDRRHPDVRTSANALIRVLDQRNGRRRLVAAHESIGPDRRRLRGVGIFAPVAADTPAGWKLQRVTKPEYEALELVKDSGWGDVVYSLFELRVAAQRAAAHKS
jgi:hypothetical protein